MDPPLQRDGSAIGSGQSQIRSRLTAVTAAFDVKSHGLAVVQLTNAGALNGRDVDENVFATFGRCNKAEALWFG